MKIDDESCRIAKWCGWTDIRHAMYNDYFLGNGPQGVCRRLPDYPNSLDACREFERVAKERGDWVDYVAALLSLCTPYGPISTRYSYLPEVLLVVSTGILEATPTQRVGAILGVIESVEEPRP